MKALKNLYTISSLSICKYIFIIELTVLIGARNILQRPRLHKNQVHPELGTSTKAAKDGKKSMKRKVPVDKNFFAPKTAGKKGDYFSINLKFEFSSFNLNIFIFEVKK